MIPTAKIHLKIADFILQLIVPNDVSFNLDCGFEGYIIETDQEQSFVKEELGASDKAQRKTIINPSNVAPKTETDLKIYCHVGCSNAPKVWGGEIYSANNGEDVLWKIFNSKEGICIHVNDSENLSRLQHIAFYQEKKQEWTIYSDLNESQALESLRYPMLPLILYYLTTQTKSLLVHASGVFDGKHGRLFSGFSGVGKSTMAGLWQNAGAGMINDDRLMLRKLDGRWWMFNTPMYYTDVPKKAPLDYIYLPFHHPENTFERGNDIQMCMRFMAHVIQHGYNPAHIQWHLDQILDINKEIPTARLGVVPNMAVLTFIKDHEQA